MKDITLGEVIINRYLKKYNEIIIEYVNETGLCPGDFGYEKNYCTDDCNYCYKRPRKEHRECGEMNSNKYKIIYNHLKTLCENNDVTFIPTEELEVKENEKLPW